MVQVIYYTPEVCLSVRPFPFRSVTLEPLQGFRRNLTQMLTRLRRRAAAMFRMAGFKVKVILRLDMTLFPFCSVTLEPLERFLNFAPILWYMYNTLDLYCPASRCSCNSLLSYQCNLHWYDNKLLHINHYYSNFTLDQILSGCFWIFLSLIFIISH